MNLQQLQWLQKQEEDDKFDGCLGYENDKIWIGYRIDLIRERHVKIKDEAKIASRGTDWDDIIAER